MLLALILATCAALLILAYEWHAYDHRRATRPLEPTYGDAQAWADELDASLDDHAVLVHHGVVSPAWAPPPALLARLGMMGRDYSHVPYGRA